MAQGTTKGVPIDIDPLLAADNDLLVPSQKAVKSYIDNTSIKSINSLTGAAQTIVAGTSGTDFAISSTGTTHTFNLPTASAANRGALSSADWTTFNSKVPATRSLTINGTTQDLSADRTFTITTGLTVGTTPITSGTIGRVLFEGTGNVLQESANFLWDNTNNRLTVRSTGEASRGIAQEEYSTGQGAASMLFQKSRGTFASPLNVNTNDLVGAFIFNARVGGAFTSDRCLFGANMASTTGIGMYFITGSTNNYYIPTLYLHSSGNVVIGSTQNILSGITDSGYKFDVLSGSARIQGKLTVGIGVNASAYLEVNSTAAGFLPPRMTTTQKNAIASPASGLVVYDTTLGKLCVRGAAAWETITSV